MLSGIFNAIYEVITGKSRFVYYSVWYSGKEVGRYMSKREARRVIRAFELTGVLTKTVEKTWWSKVGALRRETNSEYIAAYFHGFRD
ncbi:hypothetical protein IJJ18_01250 [Candidatus Saccharibacteria bacterium]|nr:hypothetical protein [Candidatus Saccharibacteria bacterium]